MFVLSGALVRTGTLEGVASWLVSNAEKRPRVTLGIVGVGEDPASLARLRAQTDRLVLLTALIRSRVELCHTRPVAVELFSEPTVASPIHRASLVLRTVLFAAWQALFAVGFVCLGVDDPWARSVAWWPMSASLANLCNFGLLLWAARKEGSSFVRLLGGRRDTWKRDMRWCLLALLVIAPLAVVPNMALGELLFGDASVPAGMMFRPLPLWAAAVVIPLFPLSIALTELPTYYAYGVPGLQAATGRRWSPMIAAACCHAFQHVALPLILDWRFITWRLLMFLPFALFIAWLIDRRRTVLPYMMGAHGLLDAQLPVFILLASLGTPVFGG